MGRIYHAAVCLWNGGDRYDHPQLLITGGRDENDKVLSDAWILDLQAGRWREVRSVLSVWLKLKLDQYLAMLSQP